MSNWTERDRLRVRERYRSEPGYRDRKLAMRRQRYAEDPEYRAKLRLQKQKHAHRRTSAQRRTQLLHLKYGMTDQQYDAMLVTQRGRCGICLTDTPKGRFNRWNVDHCHVTGQVRGLLCWECNKIVRDDADLLLAAANWVQGATPQAGASEGLLWLTL